MTLLRTTAAQEKKKTGMVNHPRKSQDFLHERKTLPKDLDKVLAFLRYKSKVSPYFNRLVDCNVKHWASPH